MKWDVFISYASRDKDVVARPLANRLTRAGLKVWIDQCELQIGDSLRSKIDEGLAQCRFGIVVLSDAFFSAQWPQRELGGLVARESHGHRTILPVLHNIDRDVLARNSPALAALHSVNTSEGLDHVAATLLQAIRDDDVIAIGDYPAVPRLESSQTAIVNPPLLLVGRDDAIAELKRQLLAARASRSSDNTVIIQGLPGVGKTALASALCRDFELADAFPDGRMWASLGQAPNLLSLLISWGRLLGLPEVSVTADLERARSLLAAGLRESRALFVLDDVWDPQDAQVLMVGGPSSAAVITTRMPSVANALASSVDKIYSLGVLSESDSLKLLRILVPEAVANDPVVAMDLVRELEGLPLAIRIAAGLLKSETSRGFGLADVLHDVRHGSTLLRHARAALGENTESLQPGVAALLAKSTDQLEPAAREALAFLGAFAPKPATFDLQAMKAVWGVSDPMPLARLLVDRGLLEAIGNGRFQIHSLVAAHARSLLE